MSSSKVKLSCDLLFFLLFFLDLINGFFLFDSILFGFLFFRLAFLSFYFFHAFSFNEFYSCIIVEFINILSLLLLARFRLIRGWFILYDTETFLHVRFNFLSVFDKFFVFETIPILAVKINYCIHLCMNYRMDTTKVFQMTFFDCLALVILMWLRRLLPQESFNYSIGRILNGV